jgi:fermentation-respiration switch protein FrsA (DUF1100 family)
LLCAGEWRSWQPAEDLHGRDVQFPSDSGSTIHGWLIPGKPGAGAVVLLHGVRSSRADMVGRARFLSVAGYTVLLFDFQAHGESPGRQITFGYLESRDARAAVQFLRASAPGEKIGVLGVSLGGVASLLATPNLEADAFILEMVYPTFDQAVGDRLAMRLGNWSRVLTPFLTGQLKLRAGVSAQELRPIDHVSSLEQPKFFIGGSADQHTTLSETRELFARASEPKELWVVDGAKHQNLHAFSANEYERRVLAFFERYLRGKTNLASRVEYVSTLK